MKILDVECRNTAEKIASYLVSFSMIDLNFFVIFFFAYLSNNFDNWWILGSVLIMGFTSILIACIIVTATGMFEEKFKRTMRF